MISLRTIKIIPLIFLLASCVFSPVSPSTEVSSPSLPASVTASETAFPTFTPSPTPTPEARVKTGDQSYSDGDYDQARLDYQAALDSSSDPDIQAAALWGLGRTETAVKNESAALRFLRQLTSQFPASTNAIRAYYLMGDIFMALNRYNEAAQAYTVFLALRPGVIDSFVQEKRGDAYAAAGYDADALSAYQVSLAATHIGDDTALQMKIAEIYLRSGEPSSALEIYGAIFTGSSNDFVKAQMDLLTGQIYLSQGQTDQAYQHFLHAVDNYPLSYDSYSALVSLVNANVPVDDMNRGLVDYFAGQYGYALAAFNRVIDSNPENDGTVHYYTAMTLDKMGETLQAIDEFTYFIENYPENRYWQAAWDEKASVQSSAPLYDYQAAVQTLLSFVQKVPNDATAPVYLMEAARNLERDGELEEAAKIWDQVASDYPGSELVPQALFWAGIAHFRFGNYSDALVSFQRDSILSINLDDQARAQFWIGKTQQVMGDSASSQAAWQRAAAIDSTDYYGLRAQDYLFSRTAFSAPSSLDLTINFPTERTEAEAWLRVIFNLPKETDLSNPDHLQEDPRFIRGTEFLKLGLHDQTILEFNDLAKSVETSAADCYRLSNYLIDLGEYRSAINIIENQLLPLAGMETYAQMSAAPIYFTHIRFGLYYQEIVLPVAQQTGFDPLLIFSIIRQESLFDKYAGSGQGALGLMQITPDTGQFIADNLGWPPNYTSEDLYRPLISLGLGAHYLMGHRLNFDQEIFTTLAAYNAGPNAAAIWRELSGPDPDLFVEVIRYEETRNYIRSIYEIDKIYQSLYSLTP